jgi:hypothetical protein
MRLSYAILSAATLASNTQRDSVIMVILTCQPQSSGCEKVEQKPVFFQKKNSNRNRAHSSRNTNKRIRNGAELLSPQTCEETSSAVGDDDDNGERDGKEDEDNEIDGTKSTICTIGRLRKNQKQTTNNKQNFFFQ